MTRPASGNYTVKTPSYGTLYSVNEWLRHIRDKLLINYDGYGYAVKDGMCDPGKALWPSEAPSCVPKDATHVIWFNR